MSDDDDRGLFGLVEALLAIVGAITLIGIAAVAASVLAWELELRKSDQEQALPEPPNVPTA